MVQSHPSIHLSSGSTTKHDDVYHHDKPDAKMRKRAFLRNYQLSRFCVVTNFSGISLEHGFLYRGKSVLVNADTEK